MPTLMRGGMGVAFSICVACSGTAPDEPKTAHQEPTPPTNVVNTKPSEQGANVAPLGVVGGGSPQNCNGDEFFHFPEPCENAHGGSDGCNEVLDGTGQWRCNVVAGWVCSSWPQGEPSVCHQIVCGDGDADAPEQCDDGALNSDTVPGACRTDCTKPRCGDGVEDDPNGIGFHEVCDDGAYNGGGPSGAAAPGLCNATCSGFAEETILPFQTSTLTEFPPGTVGLLMSERIYEPMCLPEVPDFASYEVLWSFLESNDFLVGMRIQIAEDIQVVNPIGIYDPGPNAYGDQRLYRSSTAHAEVLLGPVEIHAGDSILVGIHGGDGLGCDGCGTAGNARFDFCSEEGINPPSGGVCPDGPETLCPSNRTTEFVNGLDVLTLPGEPVSMLGVCGTQCMFSGSVTICSNPGTPPIEGADDLLRDCAVPTGNTQVDPICAATTAAGGYSGGSTCECLAADQCGVLLEKNESLTGRSDSCGIQGNFEINENCDDRLQAIIDSLDETNEQLAIELKRSTIEQMWGFCTSSLGRERCRDLKPNQPYSPDQADDGTDDSILTCSTRADSSPRNCFYCADRNGGACIATAYDERFEFLEQQEEQFELNPVAKDLESAAFALSDVQLRTAAVPKLYNPKQMNNLVADPVVLPTGELVMTETDVSFPSRGVPFELTRSYRSGGDWHGALGPGWVHNYEDLIEPVGFLFNRRGMPAYCTGRIPLIRCLLRHTGDGSTELYVYDPATRHYLPQPGSFGIMTMKADGRTGLMGYELTEPGGMVRRYDPTGVLRSIVDADGFGVTLDWNVDTPAETEARGSWVSQQPRAIDELRLSEEESWLSHSVKENLHRLAQMELTTATDSYGRVITFNYGTYHPNPIVNPGGPYNQRRLQSISYREEELVHYEYTDLAVTNKSYLTRITRTGMTASMEPATPIVTEFDYQHDVLFPSTTASLRGAIAPPVTVLDDAGLLRKAVNSEVAFSGQQLAACIGAIQVNGPVPLEACEQPLLIGASEITGGTTVDFWPVVYLMVADNIIRVRRGGSANTDTELESFFDPDPTSSDFDRVVKQRYGVLPTAVSTDTEGDQFQGSGAVLHRWKTDMPEMTLFQLPVGDAAGVSAPVFSNAYDANRPDPQSRNRFTASSAHTSASFVAARDATGASFVAHDPFDAPPTPPGAPCLSLDASLEMPFFHMRAPIGDQAGQNLSTEPTTIRRTKASCSEIAARHARDPFLNDMTDLSEVDPASPLLDQRRRAIEWDESLVCRWVQMTDRRGVASTYGINFMGRVVIETHPSPTGTGFATTKRRYNADGLLVEEIRPDTSKTTIMYAGQTRGQGATLLRALPATIVERTNGAAAPVDVSGSISLPVARQTTFVYEPLFQQLAQIQTPDLTTTQFFYDYQQLGAGDPEAQFLLDDFIRRTGIDLRVAGTALGVPTWRNQDLDGDGTAGIERSNGLVLSTVLAVDVGGGVTADVGERTMRDDCGTPLETHQVKSAFVPSLDTDRIEYLYYEDLDAAEAGAEPFEDCRCSCGPLALTRAYRTPTSSSDADLDEVKVVYDALGGVFESVSNGDPDTMVTTERNSVGLVVSELRPNDLLLTYLHDARGQVYRETAFDGVEALSIVEHAWGNQGVSLGSCRSLDNSTSRCSAFRDYAIEVVASARVGDPLPAVLPQASSVVTLLDLEELDVGSVDATGGRTDRVRNNAGVVVTETVQADPSADVVTSLAYDIMGRVIRQTRGSLLKTFFRYDGFGRLAETQANTLLSRTAFTAGEGTIATTRYDLMDRETTSFVVGDNGAASRRFLQMSRTNRNAVGAPRYVHTLAQATLPTTEPPLPGPGITAANIWATQELRYDHALRSNYHLPEGRTVATTATFNGFGVATLNAPTETIAVTTTPLNRTRVATHTLVGENGGQVRTWRQTDEWDGAGNATVTQLVDLGDNVVRTSTSTYDALGRPLEVVDPTLRTTSFAYDDGGRVSDRIERVGTTTHRVTSFLYDAMGRLDVENPEGAPDTDHDYDLAGRLEQEESGSGSGLFEVVLRYDAAGRALSRQTRKGANPTRTTSWTYASNVSSAQQVSVDAVVAKVWVRDGLDRPVIAEDRNKSDGTATFNASRPTLKTKLTYDAMGRVLQDRTDQVVASLDTQRANLNWVQPLSFLGPTSATTFKGETVAWNYTTRGSLRSVTRTGTAGTRTATASFANAGGLWTRATTFADGADKVILTKTRDAFGAVVESSAFDASNLRFQEDVLRGPTGRITAERRTSTLLDARARGYQYDALRRLQVVNIDTSTTLTRTNFLAQRNAALASEATGLGVVSSPNAQVRPTLTQADFLTAANSDHLNRAYVATGTSTAAGVPPATVNNLATTQDTRDRISTDGTLTYTWDVFDRLVLVMRGSLEEMRISYDGLGRRRLEKRLVTKPGSAQATEDAILEYVGGNVIEESVLGASTILLSVTHGPGLDAPIFVGNGPTAAATETWVIGTTARGDAATAINATTLAVTEEAYLDPWGERESIVTVGSVCFEGNEATIAGVGASRPSAACATQSKVLQRFGIAGARLHARTKLADMRNRVYATHLRAFLTKDPLGNVDSEGLWNYVAADPVNLRDPMGLDAKPVTPTPEPASTPSASAPEPPPCEGDDCAPMEVTSDSATTRRPKPPEATVLELVASALTGGKAPDVRPSDTPAVDLGGVVRAIAGFAAGIGDVVQGAAASMTPMTYAESSLAFASAAVAFGADVRERGFQGTARARVRGVKDQVSASISSSIRSEFALGRAVPTLVVALAGGGAGLRSAVAGGVERASIVRYDAKRKGHIFRDSDGHVNPSTNSSRLRFARLFERVGSNPKFLRTDAVEANLITPHGAKAGLQAFTWSTMRGQVWVTVRDGLIQHAGVNAVGRFR